MDPSRHQGPYEFKDADRDFGKLFTKVADSSHAPDLLLHKVPGIPISIDDNKANPGDVRDFMGKPLHTVLDPDALEGKLLRIFSDKEKAESYCLETVARMNPHNPPPPGGGYLDLYEHDWFGGCGWRFLESDFNIGDFTKYWGCGFLWWGWKNLNDITTSVDCYTSGRSVVVLAEHINLGGSWLWIPSPSWITNLGIYGWNDIASSAMLMYF